MPFPDCRRTPTLFDPIDEAPPVHTVCFTGHRTIADADALFLPELLEQTIRALLLRGATEFRAGGALGFDTVAALKVLYVREQFPDVHLCLYLPCRDQDALWSENERAAYRTVLAAADEILYVSETYTAGCMMARNRRLVDGSDVCLAYCRQNRGGSYNTCLYAQKQGLEIYNLANHIPQNPPV